jgi:hypothetical protein
VVPRLTQRMNHEHTKLWQNGNLTTRRDGAAFTTSLDNGGEPMSSAYVVSPQCHHDDWIIHEW